MRTLSVELSHFEGPNRTCHATQDPSQEPHQSKRENDAEKDLLLLRLISSQAPASANLSQVPCYLVALSPAEHVFGSQSVALAWIECTSRCQSALIQIIKCILALKH